MDYQQIEEIYSNKQKYIDELDPTSNDFQRLLIETVEWKIPHLVEIIPPSYQVSSVAEIGCFVGHLIGNIAINGQTSFQRYGYDINPNAIQLAKNLYPRVDFFAQDCFSTEKKFDLLILSDIVEHIEDDEEFLVKCKAISKFVLLNLPLEKSFASINRQYGFDDPSGHLRAYGIREAESLIKKAGYKIINKQILSIVNTPTDLKRRQIDNISTSTSLVERSKLVVRSVASQMPPFCRVVYGCNLFAFLEAKD
jgi:SAM-dependent methyltransferase